MATGKTTTLTFRIEPAVKEHRSIANMVAVLIRDYCGRNGITIQEPQALAFGDDRTTKSPKK